MPFWGRNAGATVGLAAAFLSLKPVAQVERVLGYALVPTRLVATIGVVPSAVLAGASRPVRAERAAEEEELSLRLERAVLSSAWPASVEIPEQVVPVPGEVDARQASPATTGCPGMTDVASSTRTMM